MNGVVTQPDLEPIFFFTMWPAQTYGIIGDVGRVAAEGRQEAVYTKKARPSWSRDPVLGLAEEPLFQP